MRGLSNISTLSSERRLASLSSQLVRIQSNSSCSRMSDADEVGTVAFIAAIRAVELPIGRS